MKSEMNIAVSDKPIVLYKSFYEDSSYTPVVGEKFDVIPINHPNSYLNGIWTVTSQVVSVEENGQDFETIYSKYVLDKENV